MEFWRGEAYTAYVDYLEGTGGFYYEVSLRFEHHPSMFSLMPAVYPFRFVRGGAMHRYTLWGSLSSFQGTRSTFSIKSATRTSHIRTAHKIWISGPDTAVVWEAEA